jgi:4'-phosphopantetheinyl transferase
MLKMDPHNSHSIFPVILKVPDEKRALAGRASVAFLRQFARRAVLLSAEKSGMDLKELHNDASGAPIPANGVFWSLSHKPCYVVGVTATRPVGIDVEPIRPVSKALFNKILDDREQKLAGTHSQEFFYRCWTAKEAVLKVTGVGLRGLSRCKILRFLEPANVTVSYDEHPWEIEQVLYDDHIVSVVTQGQAVCWVLPGQSHDVSSLTEFPFKHQESHPCE